MQSNIMVGSNIVKIWSSGFKSLALVSLLFFCYALCVESKGAPESFADLVEELSPAVVNITNITTPGERHNTLAMPSMGSFEAATRVY